MGHFRIAADTEVHIERVGFVAHLEEDIPEGQAIFSARYRHEDAIILSEHLFRLDGSATWSWT